ncbi:MAG: hypothetical protein AB1942_10070 [Pseudomonadota bacterium]
MQAAIAIPVGVLTELEREGALMGDATFSETITRRVATGVAALGVALDLAMDWREPASHGPRVIIHLSSGLEEAVKEVCELTGRSLDAVLLTFTASRQCRPTELVYLDALSSSWAPPNRIDRYSHTDVDWGPVYLASVAMPGYWIEFLTLVGDRRLALSSVLHLALQALAREIIDTGQVIGVEVGRETLSLARRFALFGEPVQANN